MPFQEMFSYAAARIFGIIASNQKKTEKKKKRRRDKWDSREGMDASGSVRHRA